MGAMTRARTFTIAAVAFLYSAATVAASHIRFAVLMS
jgi:hypothetical protein